MRALWPLLLLVPVLAAALPLERRWMNLAAPIKSWDEALPLGNGLLGALVWGEGNLVRISLDRGDLWDLRVPERFKEPGWNYANILKLIGEKNQAEISRLFDEPYDNLPYPTKLPGARLEVELPEGWSSQAFKLDLVQAEARVDFGKGEARAIVASHRPVVLAEFPAEVMFRIRRPAAEPKAGFNSLDSASIKALGYPDAAWGEQGDEQWFVQEAALGLRYAVVAKRALVDGKTVIAATIAKGPKALEEGRRIVDEALRSGYGKTRSGHLRFWNKHRAASDVRIPNAKIQAQYDFARYLYGAGSRRNAPPMPLQGVWTADAGSLPPWKGDYHNDLNTQTIYIGYQAAGLVESGRSLLDYLWNLRPNFRGFAKSFYGVPGLVVPGVMDLEGRPLGGWSQYSLSPTHTAWLAHLFHRHWKFTADPKFLRTRAYPWCKEAGEALASMLTPDAEGKLVLPASASPEFFDNSFQAWLKPNSTYDQALLDELFLALQEMAEALGNDSDERRWADLLAKRAPYRIDPESGSLMVSAGLKMDSSHRHFSNQMPIHPFGRIHVEDAWGKKVADATLDNSIAQGTKQWTGYSFSWMACSLARAGRSEEALRFLSDYLAFTLRNGFHVNGDQSGRGLSSFTYRPFTLEGNFLAMEAVHEMLLQSWGGRVRIFPAVSSEWKDASFRDLRAEGGFRVSAERREGKTALVSVSAAVPATLRLKDPFEGKGIWSRTPAKSKGDLVWELDEGETVAGRLK